jgi:phosphotransferase system  glucose/maltose/N-acetylglucosamine-specific IIC component
MAERGIFMKNMLYGIGLLISGSIGVGCCIVAVYQNQMFSDSGIIDKLLYSNISLPFTVFCVLAFIGIIVSTKEFFNK